MKLLMLYMRKDIAYSLIARDPASRDDLRPVGAEAFGRRREPVAPDGHRSAVGAYAGPPVDDLEDFEERKHPVVVRR